jgi:tRNA-specific 2-thiouridylase
MQLRDVNWLGDNAPADLAATPREVHVKVRSTRPPQPAWLQMTPAGAEVELIDGEDGVSPGQACVFYDAPSGQARVLGGGFIASAVAAETRAPAMATAGLRAARG